jgi:ribosomal protein L11 methyltransferase
MLTLTIEAPEPLEDALVAQLWRHGGLGSWSEAAVGGRVRIHGFVSADCDELRLAKSLRIDPAVVVSRLEPVGDRDWAATWRRTSGPIQVGERFVVDPREPGEIDAPVEARGRILLRLPARTAFGTGSHASTRLAVELLETLDVAGRDLLDVGAGSGILSFAALALGARRAVALDLDPAAALLIPGYSSLNALRLSTFAGRLVSIAAGARFDLALVNVIPSEIADDLPQLAALVRPGGLAVFSGILETEAERAVAAVRAVGFAERSRKRDGEWTAFVAERDAGAR